MSERGDGTSRPVDRRHFMLGATNVFSAAALAGWLAGPDSTEGATGASPELRTLNTKEFVLHQEAPTITAVDGSGQNLGDAFYFNAELRLDPGGAVVGHVFGVKTVVKMDTVAPPGVEQRLTHLFFISTDRQHQIVVAGVPDYPVNGAEFAADQPLGAGRPRRDRGIPRRTRPADQYAPSRRRLHAGLHPARLIAAR